MLISPRCTAVIRRYAMRAISKAVRKNIVMAG
jgi:hypothetical protein